MSTIENTIDDIKTKKEEKTKKPNMWKVIFLNDDFTPFDFVVYVIFSVFNKSLDESFNITTKIHKEGSAVVGVYTHDVAETKQYIVMEMAKQNGHPLLVKIEEE